MIIFRAMKWLGAAVLAGVLALVLLSFALRQPADRSLLAGEGAEIVVHVADHGYHAGLVLPRQALFDIAARERNARLQALLVQFSAFQWIEIGWGEETFYRHVPRAELSTMHHVLSALFRPGNRSVLHVVGFDADPMQVFRGSDVMAVRIREEGLLRIAREIDRQLRDDEPAPLGPGLYGPSAFFAARDTYHLFNTCNHWVGRTLGLAGLPYAPVDATLSAGLLFSLRRGFPAVMTKP